MAFELQDILTPTSIGRIDHFLDDLDGTNSNRAMRFNLEILDQFSDVLKVRSGDEVPHLDATQQGQIISFMDARRTALPTDLSFPAGHQVGRITWRIRDVTGNRQMHVRVIELDNLGNFVQVHPVNEQPNLSAGQINALIAFMDAQRGKAVAQILP